MEKLTVLFYTNENHLPIVNLAIDEFNKYSKDIDVKKILTTNSFSNPFELPFDGFEVIDTEIPYNSESRHFAKVMYKALEHVKTKYVLFLLDDMFIINPINKNNLESVLSFMDGENIDHMSLMSYGHDWKIYQTDYSKYNLPNDYVFEMPISYIYTLSTQPSIWKTDSLREIFKHNQDMTIWEYDTTNVKNMRGEKRPGDNGTGYMDTPTDFWDYGFKHCCFKRYFENTPYPFDDRPFDGDYFLFLWVDVINKGKFCLNRHQNCRIFLTDYLEKNNIDNNHIVYGKYL